MQRNTITCASAIDFTNGLPDNSVDCIVTSPPYLDQRDYKVEGQWGSESTPKEFIEHLISLFNEANRVLKPTGTVWVNLGDSYSSGGRGSSDHHQAFMSTKTANAQAKGRKIAPFGFREKSLMMIPSRFAVAMIDNGWILRSEIVWEKPNAMPESVTDRPTKSHEMIYLFTKSPDYWYDLDAIREPQTGNTHSRGAGSQVKHSNDRDRNRNNPSFNKSMTAYIDVPGGRNKRTVWSIPTKANHSAHFATFPQNLITPMILAGCPLQVCLMCGNPYERSVKSVGETPRQRLNKLGASHYHAANSSGLAHKGSHDQPSRERITLGFIPTCKCNSLTGPGLVFDPFMGSGTTALVARRLGRDFLGCDLNPEYVVMAQERLACTPSDRPVANGITQLAIFKESTDVH